MMRSTRRALNHNLSPSLETLRLAEYSGKQCELASRGDVLMWHGRLIAGVVVLFLRTGFGGRVDRVSRSHRTGNQ